MLDAIDREYWSQGRAVIGVDEVGRGALAGSVAAGAVFLRSDPGIEGIDDSKKLSPKKRENLAPQIEEKTVWAVRFVDSRFIDEYGIQESTFQAMRQAVDALKMRVPVQELESAIVLVDGTMVIPTLEVFLAAEQRAVVNGDEKSLAIAAASIVAKVSRDGLMTDFYDKQWPVYGFRDHKGYGTEEHLRALKEHGPCPVHRRSFAPLRTKEEKKEEDVKSFGFKPVWTAEDLKPR